MGATTMASTPGPADVVGFISNNLGPMFSGFISNDLGPMVSNPIGLKVSGPTKTVTTPHSRFASANYYASLDYDPPVAQSVPASSTE